MTFHALTSSWEAAPRLLPAGTTLLAVGDVHGCVEHLDALLAWLTPGMRAAAGRDVVVELVLLGDYVDRGPDSPGALARLRHLQAQLDGKAVVTCLRGNHDQFLIDHLRTMPHPGTLELWLTNGGLKTVAQMGMDPEQLIRALEDGNGLAELAQGLRERLGPKLVDFVQELALAHRVGDYFCVHAGIRPEIPLDQQQLVDLLWIREPFLNATAWPHPLTVVHGHTPAGPEVLPHRIGVDSGCFFTGVLTAVEIEADRLRFHAVTRDPDPRAFWELIAEAQPRRFGRPEPVPMEERS